MFPATNSLAHTTFVRFKIDSFQNPTNCVAQVFTSDYDWTIGRGIAVRLAGTDPDNLYIVLDGNQARYNLTETQGGEAKNRLAKGKWIDMAVVVSNNYGYVYTCVDGGDFTYVGSRYFGNGGAPSAVGNFYLGADRTSTTSFSSDRTGYFRGWVHQAALWPYALSENDVKAVFGFPSPDVFRVGVENGSSAEFYGSSATSYLYPENADFRDAPVFVAAGSCLTISFNLTADEVKNQLLRIAAAHGSASASFSVEVNGREAVSYDDRNAPVHVMSVAPGGSATFGVLSNYFRSGSNTLTITRTDSGIGVFEIDSLSLGSRGRRVRVGRPGVMLFLW